MNLIKPYFEILEQQPGIDGIYKMIELAGRTCYRSEDKITEDSAKGFVDRMVKSGHGAMLEHGTVYLHIPNDDINWDFYYSRYRRNQYSKCDYFENIHGKPLMNLCITTNYRVLVENDWLDDLKYLCEPTKYHAKRITVKFILSRSIAQEYTRHRVFSFAMESQRYCNYSKNKYNNEVTFCIPCWCGDLHSGNSYDMELINNYPLAETENLSPESIELIRSLVYAESSYFVLLESGWKPQQAREVLPNACKTELVMTGFVSQWKDFFLLRSNKYGKGGAHPSADELATPLYEEFVARGYIK